MDSFVKRFFPDYNAPGLRFGPMGMGMVRHTYMQGSLKVFDQQMVRNRTTYFSQPMTLLGRVNAKINTSTSSLDGLGKPFLTPEGMVNLQVIGDTLKAIGGMQTPTWSAHMGTVRAWSWSDNHVSLLVNALRYVLITKNIEDGGTITDELPEYNDGHVRIDRNQWWSDYPEHSSWDVKEWPVGEDKDPYPSVVRLVESHPTQAYNAIDLRGLSGEEARFILLMLSSWTRRSRMRLDFPLPRLTENIYYRSDVEIPGLAGWLVEPADKPKVPTPPNSSVAWSALMKYVSRNRIFDHFSTALHLVTSLMYQFLPVTAEANIWLSFDWNLSLPAFASIRGRYTFLNEDEAAFVSHRALGEWSYIGNKLEKIHLMAVVFIQAIQTGLAVRSVRKGLEISPEDLFNTYTDFYSPSNMIAAAAAEAVRGTVPLPGMSGVYVNLTEDFDVYHPDRRVAILNSDIEGLEGYDLDDEDVEVITVTEVSGDAGETSEEGSGSRRRAVRTTETRHFIKAQWSVFAGLPTMILPLNPFPYNSIFSLKGSISPDLGKLERRGFRVAGHQAWLITSIYRIAGYDLSARFNGETAGACTYFAPNDLHVTWPVLFEPDEQEDDVILFKQTERPVHFIDLPVAINNFFKGQKIDYDMRIMRRGMAMAYAEEREDIIECDGIMSMFSKITLTYTVTGNVQRLRAYISRDESGFRFVDNVTGGVIPTTPETAAAPDADAH